MRAKKIFSIASLGILLASSSSLAQEVSKAQLDALQAQIKQLQAQINALQKKQEVAEIETQKIKSVSATQSASVDLGSKGLAITSADKKYQFKMKGFAQADSRTYFNDSSNNADQFLIRSAKVYFDTKLPGGFSGRVVNDFAASTMTEAYMDWSASSKLNLRGGKFKPPVGLERWQSETDMAMIERGLTTNLTASRDVGFGAYGELIPGSLEYQVAVTNGAADGVVGSTDTSGGKDFVGRIFAQPFKNSGNDNLKGLGIGIAGSIGQKDGTTTNTELTSGYKTSAQNNFFTYSAGTFAEGENTRLNPQAWYYNGPLGIITEYVTEDIGVQNGTTKATLTNNAWMASASYVLTGENAAFDGVKPEKDFDAEKGNWGAFEIAVRIGELDIDNNSFGTFASSTASASSIEEKVVGLSWYLSQNVRLSFNYANNKFEGGATTGNRPDEDVFLARAQFKF